MEKNETKPRGRGRPISRQDCFDAILLFCVWAVGFGIANFLIGWMFSGVGSALWACVGVGTFLLVVVYNMCAIREGKYDNPSPAPQPIIQTGKEESVPVEHHDDAPPETAMLRRALVADINACLDQTDYSWVWATRATVSAVNVFKESDRSRTYAGSLSVVDRRVEYITVSLEDRVVKFHNHALLEAQREERARIEAPIVAFLGRRVPDAKWAWESAADGTIILSSAKLSVEKAVAKVRYAKADGHVTSLDLVMPDGTIKNIKNVSNGSKRQAGAGQQESEGNGTKKTKCSKYRSTIVATRRPAINVEAMPIAEETAANLLSTTDTPPVDDDILRRAANQLAEYDALEISELATSTEESGESSFVWRWPEGLQTKKEAEFYAEAFVSSGEFARVEVDAKNETFTFWLPDAYAN